MVLHWILSDSKFPQVSRALPSILADLNNAVVWMDSTHPLIYKSASLYNNPLVTVARAPITIDITIIFMFHSFFSFSSKVKEDIFPFGFFQFYTMISGGSKVHNSANYYYKVW